jgi:hypothetical protein
MEDSQMTPEEPPSPYFLPEDYAHPPGAPAQPPPSAARRRLPRAALAGGIAVGLALGGAGAAFAATSSSSSNTPSASAPTTSTPTTTTPTTTPGGRHLVRPGIRFGMGIGGDVLHGEYTIDTGNGKHETLDVQIGKASNVSPTSITVTSADGYAHTYVVTPTTLVDAQRDGIASVASGDQVRLTATNANGTQTATNIIDTTKVTKGGLGFGKPVAPFWAPGGPAVSPPAA